jgi:hypothetical protein
MNKPDFLNEIAQSIERMDEDVRAHFRLVTRMLMDCYLDDSQKAAVLFTRGAGQPASLVSVNADDEELSEMMCFMRELSAGAMLNGAGLPSERH